MALRKNLMGNFSHSQQRLLSEKIFSYTHMGAVGRGSSQHFSFAHKKIARIRSNWSTLLVQHYLQPIRLTLPPHQLRSVGNISSDVPVRAGVDQDFMSFNSEMANKFLVIKIIHRGSVISLKVPLVGRKWSWVAHEVLRRHRLSMDEAQRSESMCLRISGILSPSREPLDMTQNILYYDVFEYGIFELLTEGPWVMLQDSHLLRVLEYLPGIGDLRSLMGVSKRFKKLFSSDQVWSQIPFTFNQWRGMGRHGSEDDDWAKTQRDSGLTILNSHRLRWNSHTTSRLRLFYGRFDEPRVPYFDPFRTYVPPIQNTILLLGGNDGSQLVSRLMQQLHYLVPESATAFHLRCRPLLAETMTTDVEASPLTSRSRRHSTDPGTRVESTKDQKFQYRRLGDPRLTFLGMDLPEELGEFRYDLYYELTKQTCGNVILLQHNALNPLAMAAELKHLWDALQYSFGSKDSPLDWGMAKSHRYGVSGTPVLILLLVDWTVWMPLGFDANLYRTSKSVALGITEVVKEVDGMMRKIATSTPSSVNGLHTHSRSWYVQPVDSCSQMAVLNTGTFSGLNWLIREVIAQQEARIRVMGD